MSTSHFARQSTKKHTRQAQNKTQFRKLPEQKKHQEIAKKNQQITKLAPGKAQDVLGQSCTQLS